MDTRCKLNFKRDNILQLLTSNSLVDYKLSCPPLIDESLTVTGDKRYIGDQPHQLPCVDVGPLTIDT